MLARGFTSSVICGRLYWRGPDGPDWKACLKLPIKRRLRPWKLSVLELEGVTNGSTNRKGDGFPCLVFKGWKLKLIGTILAPPRGSQKNRPAYLDEPISAEQYQFRRLEPCNTETKDQRSARGY